jgi:hypothetical protein
MLSSEDCHKKTYVEGSGHCKLKVLFPQFQQNKFKGLVWPMNAAAFVLVDVQNICTPFGFGRSYLSGSSSFRCRTGARGRDRRLFNTINGPSEHRLRAREPPERRLPGWISSSLLSAERRDPAGIAASTCCCRKWTFFSLPI